MLFDPVLDWPASSIGTLLTIYIHYFSQGPHFFFCFLFNPYLTITIALRMLPSGACWITNVHAHMDTVKGFLWPLSCLNYTCWIYYHFSFITIYTVKKYKKPSFKCNVTRIKNAIWICILSQYSITIILLMCVHVTSRQRILNILYVIFLHHWKMLFIQHDFVGQVQFNHRARCECKCVCARERDKLCMNACMSVCVWPTGFARATVWMLHNRFTLRA